MNNSKYEPLEWHTEQRRIQDLSPWNKNPRRMTEKQAADLRTSLEHLNLMSIPVVDADNTIISGHQRMKLMQAIAVNIKVNILDKYYGQMTENIA